MTDVVQDLDFVFEKWLDDIKISTSGRTKLYKCEITDLESLLLISEDDIVCVKLAPGDRAKFTRAVKDLSNNYTVSDGSAQQSVTVCENPSPIAKQDTNVVTVNSNTSTQDSNVVSVDPNASNNPIGLTSVSTGVPQSVPTQSNPITSTGQLFSVSEVAAFLAGNQIPANVGVAIAGLRQNVQVTQAYNPIQSIYNSGVLQSPAQQTNYSPYLNPLSRHIGNQSQQFANTYQYSQIHQSSDSSQRAALNDIFGVSETQSRRSGEGLLLPVNFTSHIRGSRSDEEEIAQTPSGTKLFITNNSKKLKPENLNQGLFLGANARILARIIPNLTPEVTLYLDYLRKIGDLLVNYTSSSVYALDHEHRFEVAELGRPWNCIDPNLSLNWLKKKDGNQTNPSAGSKPMGNRNRGTAGKSSGQQQSGSEKKPNFCIHYNSTNGCTYDQNCRFQHRCSVENCGGYHPAFRHDFRAKSAQATSKQSGSSPAGSSTTNFNL